MVGNELQLTVSVDVKNKIARNSLLFIVNQSLTVAEGHFQVFRVYNERISVVKTTLSHDT